MKLPLYDEKCLDLARYFYPDMDEKRLGELAALIQVTVEDFAPPDTDAPPVYYATESGVESVG